MEYNGKRISILGMGRSGMALARILRSSGASVLVSDEKSDEKLQSLTEELTRAGISVELGGHTDQIYKDRDLIVISPGVSVYHPVLEDARRHGVPVVGEIEVAYQLSRVPMIAVTGTNGKSTTVSLIHRVLNAAGHKAILAGNIGIPLVSEIWEHPDARWIVAEISSFQLETIREFHPRIGVILNITDDHLDRHRCKEEYMARKARLFENQDFGDSAVFNVDDRNVSAIERSAKAQHFFFSRASEVDRGTFKREGSLMWKDNGSTTRVLSIDEISLAGTHNLENVMAVVTVAKILGISNEIIKTALREFVPLHHRLEYVATINGVAFYDDSKGTNPGAVTAALMSFREPVVLIAGGKDKDMDFTDLGRVIAERVKTLVVIGETAAKIAASARAGGMNDVREAGSLQEAVRISYESAPPGGVVLLSPACASFDMFKSAEHRGDMFKEIVKELEVAGH